MLGQFVASTSSVTQAWPIPYPLHSSQWVRNGSRLGYRGCCQQSNDLSPSKIGAREIFVGICGYDLRSPNARKKLFLNDLENQIRPKILYNTPLKSLIWVSSSLHFIWIKSVRYNGRYVEKSWIELRENCKQNSCLWSGLQIRVRTRNFFFLFLNQKLCCGYSKEPPRWDGSFEHQKLMGKKIITILRYKSLRNWPYVPDHYGHMDEWKVLEMLQLFF